jgi:hypothetical protein
MKLCVWSFALLRHDILLSSSRRRPAARSGSRRPEPCPCRVGDRGIKMGWSCAWLLACSIRLVMGIGTIYSRRQGRIPKAKRAMARRGSRRAERTPREARTRRGFAAIQPPRPRRCHVLFPSPSHLPRWLWPGTRAPVRWWGPKVRGAGPTTRFWIVSTGLTFFDTLRGGQWAVSKLPGQNRSVYTELDWKYIARPIYHRPTRAHRLQSHACSLPATSHAFVKHVEKRQLYCSAGCSERSAQQGLTRLSSCVQEKGPETHAGCTASASPCSKKKKRHA